MQNIFETLLKFLGTSTRLFLNDFSFSSAFALARVLRGGVTSCGAYHISKYRERMLTTSFLLRFPLAILGGSGMRGNHCTIANRYPTMPPYRSYCRRWTFIAICDSMSSYPR